MLTPRGHLMYSHTVSSGTSILVNITYEPVPIETNAEARVAYEVERCDVYTTDVSGLAATNTTFDDPNAHMVFPEIISKEPLGPLVRQGDDQWADIARWVLNALITAEELGVTQANVAEMAKGTDHPEINRMLGTEGSLAEMMGLDGAWAVRAIAAEGNYAEIFEKYLGAGSPLGLPRGLSSLYKDGGILYSQPRMKVWRKEKATAMVFGELGEMPTEESIPVSRKMI